MVFFSPDDDAECVGRVHEVWRYSTLGLLARPLNVFSLFALRITVGTSSYASSNDCGAIGGFSTGVAAIDVDANRQPPRIIPSGLPTTVKPFSRSPRLVFIVANFAKVKN